MSHRTKDDDSLRVLFCLGVLPDFFGADGETQAALLSGIPAAFEDLGGRFGLTVIGTMDDDELMVGPSHAGRGRRTSSPTPPPQGRHRRLRPRAQHEDRRGPALALHAHRGARRPPAVLRQRLMVALVTGAGQGLGRAIAHALHAAGHEVAVTDVDADRARRSPGSSIPTGRTAAAWALDVRERRAFAEAADAAEERLGPVGVLVNNAALTIARPVFEIDEDEWDEVLAVNLRGVLFGCQVLGPRMRDRGSGRIVNLSSLAGQQGGVVAGAHYAASKAGIIVLTKIVAKELAGAGVTVNAIAPAAIEGPQLAACRPNARTRCAARSRSVASAARTRWPSSSPPGRRRRRATSPARRSTSTAVFMR